MSIRLSEDNHDSWVTCTTSAECKTIITVVLTVMSGMDPHMISWNLRCVCFGLGWFGEGDLFRYGSIMARLRDVIEVRIWRRYCDPSTSIPKA
jgi:hypothetical protein